MRTSVWRELAISPSTDEREIRRAYARRLKIVHPEDDPEGFQALRAAFEQALNHARHAAWEADNGWNDDDAVDEGLDAPAAPLGENHAHPPATPSTEASPQDPALVAEMARDRADRDEHQRRCDALSEALRQAAPDSETVLTALVAVFRSPALGALDVHDSTEHWLDQLAAQRGPGFEVLLEPTITFFGWDHRPVGDHWRPGLGALQHRADLETLKRLRNRASAGHVAFMALSRPIGPRERMQARLRPELGRQISDLLARIDHEVPYVLNYLNPAAVAWWREYLSRPRFGLGSIWFTGIVTLLSALVVSAGAPAGSEGVGFLAGAGVGLSGSILLALAGHYLFVLPRWRRRAGFTADSFWRACGWAPVTALLMLLNAFLPPDPSPVQSIAVPGAVLAGIGLIWWAALVSDADRWSQRLHWLWTWPGLFIPLWFVAVAQMENRPAFYLTLVIVMLLMPVGGLHLARRWPARGAAHILASGVLIAAAAVGAGLAAVSPSFWVGAPAAAILFLAGAAGAVAAASQHPLMLNLRRWGTPLGLVAIFIGLVAVDPADQTPAIVFFAWGGAWIGGVLALTTLGDLLLALWPQRARKRHKSADHIA
nr:hypothetical protein [uncultured Brevundimonas sp.]